MHSAHIHRPCWLCGKQFIINDGRKWKFLCSRCFRLLYDGLRLQVPPLDLRQRWKAEVQMLYAKNAAHFPVDIRENLARQGIITNNVQSM